MHRITYLGGRPHASLVSGGVPPPAWACVAIEMVVKILSCARIGEREAQVESLVAADVADHVFVMGNHDERALEGLERFGNGGEVPKVDVVGGLVHDEDCGLLEDEAGEREERLLTFAQRANCLVDHPVLEEKAGCELPQALLLLPLARRSLGEAWSLSIEREREKEWFALVEGGLSL